MKDLREERDLADFVPPPEKSPARSPRRWLFAHGAAWWVWLIGVAFFVPKFEAIFKDFGVDLPRFTALVVKASHRIIVLVLPVLILLGVDWAILRALDDRGEARRYRTWSILMLAVPLLLFAATVVALFLPLVNLIDRLTG